MPSSTSSSDGRLEGLRPPPKLSFFDPEEVERPVPSSPWRALGAAALLAALVLTAGWELYWRGQWHEAGDYKNTESLWAQERRKAAGDATVILGTSRIFFGADLDVWEKESGGDRPVQLALEGTIPRVFLEDVANDKNFRGRVIVDYTGQFFVQRGGRREDVIAFVKEESVSQRADHYLSKILERSFAFIDEQTRPKRMIFLAPFPVRSGMAERTDPRKLMILGDDRNAEVWSRIMEDEPYREKAKRIWAANTDRLRRRLAPGGPLHAALSDEAATRVIEEVKTSVEKIRARGGDVVFVQYPFAGVYTAFERDFFPRARFWDRLLAETQSAGVSFEDYKELQGYELPEWSHLAPRDAERYTKALVPLLYEKMRRKAAERAAGR